MKEEKEHYRQLISAVEDIDKEAALYLKRNAIHLKEFSYHFSLDICFPWCKTKQGHAYWKYIQQRLLVNGYYNFTGRRGLYEYIKQLHLS